jgi:hypothetical protein
LIDADTKVSIEHCSVQMITFLDLQVKQKVSALEQVPILKAKCEKMKQHIAQMELKQKEFMKSVNDSSLTLLTEDNNDQGVQQTLLDLTSKTDSTLQQAFRTQID